MENYQTQYGPLKATAGMMPTAIPQSNRSKANQALGELQRNKFNAEQNAKNAKRDSELAQWRNGKMGFLTAALGSVKNSGQRKALENAMYKLSTGNLVELLQWMHSEVGPQVSPTDEYRI